MGIFKCRDRQTDSHGHWHGLVGVHADAGFGRQAEKNITEAAQSAFMIQVGRLNSTYFLDRDEPWPHAVRERLDAVARERLPAAIANALAALPAAQNDESIWMMRH